MNEDFFDCVILMEAEKLEPVFNGATLIGKVLGKLEVEEDFVGRRIEKMIADGVFDVVAKAKKDRPIYWKELRYNAE